eukprot:3413077-Rhodomonas_salina.1
MCGGCWQLNKVILSLSEGKASHIPYRDSKLTRLLQEAIGGNCRTALIICCSPALNAQAETMSTMRFGKSAKRIKNRARMNKEQNPAELKLMLEQVALSWTWSVCFLVGVVLDVVFVYSLSMLLLLVVEMTVLLVRWRVLSVDACFESARVVRCDAWPLTSGVLCAQMRAKNGELMAIINAK